MFAFARPTIRATLAAVVLFATTHSAPASDPTPPAGAPPARPDSYWYYGPRGLWKEWTAGQRHGRDTWILWTGGNQKFLRLGTELAGSGPVPVSLEYFRMLDSRNRGDRFRKFGLINEPNCVPATAPDEFGLWLDAWQGDPVRRDAPGAHPGGHYAEGKYPYYPDPAVKAYADAYGEPTGVVGLRKFRNPKFDRAKWDADAYFQAPWAVQPPYLIGFSCALCHIAFDPLNPPADPAKPRWDNLAANVGNQYLREGDLFAGRARILFGDRNPGPNRKADPYDTAGLDPGSLLYHYAATQQPGTSETSRISYDFINNPNTVNPVYQLGHRPTFPERTPDGKLRVVNHVLKDGADSVGIEMAVLRVWINIGCEGRYWLDTLYNPMTGTRQRPLDVQELRLNVPPARLAELKVKYGDDVGQDWAEAHRRNGDLISYLASYTASPLAEAPGGAAVLQAGAAKLARGKAVFADHCAECHSNKQPPYTMDAGPQKRAYFRDSVAAPTFLANNTLSDDRRYSVKRLGTNMARALATNAIDGDVWAELSSKDYKALPPVGPARFVYGVKDGLLVADPAGDTPVDFTPPGGGRGYYRTPSLVGLWATAPYLHNNAVGDYRVVRNGTPAMVANDGRPFDDPIDVSVEGRLAMFRDGMEKLLGMTPRRGYIKRVPTDCKLVDLQPLVGDAAAAAVRSLVADHLQELVAAAVADVTDRKLAAVKATAVKAGLLAESRDRLKAFDTRLKPTELADRFKADVKGQLVAKAKDLADGDFGDALAEKLNAVADRLLAKAAEWLADDALVVPAGTPVNLYFNLGPGALPHALKAHLKYRKDPQKLAAALLRLSECPDLVEDRGHTFGSELPAADKEALIEFLKTF